VLKFGQYQGWHRQQVPHLWGDIVTWNSRGHVRHNFCHLWEIWNLRTLLRYLEPIPEATQGRAGLWDGEGGLVFFACWIVDMWVLIPDYLGIQQEVFESSARFRDFGNQATGVLSFQRMARAILHGNGSWQKRQQAKWMIRSVDWYVRCASLYFSRRSGNDQTLETRYLPSSCLWSRILGGPFTEQAGTYCSVLMLYKFSFSETGFMISLKPVQVLSCSSGISRMFRKS
jgi:hypothetical protein